MALLSDVHDIDTKASEKKTVYIHTFREQSETTNSQYIIVVIIYYTSRH